MPRPSHALLVAPLLALAACATPGAASSASPAATHASSGRSEQAIPATARMICSDDLKAKVKQALRLDAAPATHDHWSGEVYTCTYHLPQGEMVLSDKVFPDAGAARTHMTSAQADDGTAAPLAGLGQQAYGSPRGVAVVLKDDQILTVDATGLPERFGASDQRRTDLAYEVASDVLGCWTGDE